jgi:hypothetical protein
MPTKEEQNKQEGLAVDAFREALLDVNIEGAKVIEREQMLPPQAVSSLVNTVFDTLIRNHNFINAIELGKSYELPKDKINDVIYMEFRRIINTGDIEKAIEWALFNHLPDYEITRAAIKGIEAAIINKNVKMAVEIKLKYSITEEQIGSVWQKGYDESIKDGKFFEAALLSREFGLSERKTIITASRAFRKAIDKRDFDQMVLVEDEFRIFNDAGFSLLSEEDGRSLIKMTEGFIRDRIRTEDFPKVVHLIHGLGVLFKEIENHTLRGLVVFVYNQARKIHEFLLKENRYDDAVWFKNELNLLESNTPNKTLREIFNQAITYHNKYLKKGNISLAMNIKKEYDLLGALSDADSIDVVQNVVIAVLTDCIEKGETKAGNSIIKEYNVPQPDIEKVLIEAVTNSLSTGAYDRAIDIVTQFKVDVDGFEIKSSSKSAFEQCRLSGYQETAANIGYIFAIDSPEVKDAARLVWEDFMRRQEFRKAAILKKKHKLSKKYTEPVAKEEYASLIELGKIEDAQKLREEYRVNVGFFSWLIEFFKKILMMLSGTDSGQIGSSESSVALNNSVDSDPVVQKDVPSE